ncbi:hypothetical protein A2U01_0063831, partial [Trifolium medium]|nr:hypothetical protein [Trifolium medium]
RLSKLGQSRMITLGEDLQRIIPLHTIFNSGKLHNFNVVNLGSVMMELSLSSLLITANISFIE